jgi:hypothetical protein
MSISNERGAVVVLVAVMLFLIFFCVALVVDIGHIHNVKIELQRAVDAAALAGAQELPGGTVEETALAMVLANGIDKQVNNADVKTEVVTGWWNTEIIQGQRWFPGGTPVNAVYVKSTLNVPHFFFFPDDDGTDVTADAIAVAQTINPVLPLAMISCIPTSGYPLEQKPKEPIVCGITSLRANVDPSDTGAWTSLTDNVTNPPEVIKLMSEDGSKFNSVIYGRDLGNHGIENTAVDPDAYISGFNSAYAGCLPNGININCGLGLIAGKDIARPDEFPAPSGYTNPLSIGITPTTIPPPFDPLTDYGKNGALPRWYNLNTSDDLQNDDHFARIWSQDGILLQGSADSEAYRLRLESYYEGSVKPFNDERFVGAAGMIIRTKVAGKYVYKPDFTKIIKHAGYPRVYMFNGTANSIFDFFIDKVAEEDTSTLKCTEDDDLPLGQQAVILKTPVIFVGSCETFNATPPTEAYYVGLAKYLLTRAWKNPKDYDCGSNFVDVSGCVNTFNPPALNGLLQAVSGPNPSGFEGVQLIPTADGEETNASLIRIYLVE